MKVEKEIWEQRMGNLMNRRKSNYPAIQPSYEILKNLPMIFFFGKTVLDVGCGDMNIKKMLVDSEYTGIDAFPLSDEVVKAEIETFAPGKKYETIVAFAVLDGLYDLKKAIENIKHLCSKNVIILTGIGILPDEYHTFEITEEILLEYFEPFKMTYRNYIAPKVLLCEFSI